MRNWQKYWLIGVIIFFSLHLVRDILQDYGVSNFLSNILVKYDQSKTPSWYWRIFNTYLFEISEIILASYCIKKRRFGFAGYLTIAIALFFLTVWLIYWILL